MQINNKSIDNIDELATFLGFPKSELEMVTNNPSQYYKPVIIIKNGKKRKTYKVFPPLSEIQAKINKLLFWNVEFPEYLQGGIHDRNKQRDPITDAKKHLDQYFILHVDIRNFFPSICTKFVFIMWKELFIFPLEVAEMLTKLTTYRGSVPQGAKTSSYISNLIFWEKEPNLEQEFREEGLIYSRYIDDIHVSSNLRLENKEVKKIYDRLFNMLGYYHLRPSYKKCDSQSKSKNMNVHSININSGKPSLSQKDRGKIRAAVHELEIYVKGEITTSVYYKMLHSVEGRIAWLAQLHPHKAELLKGRIGNVKKVFERRRIESLFQDS